MNNPDEIENLIKREMVWINREFYHWRRTVDARKAAYKQREARYDEVFERVIYPSLKPYIDLFKKYGHRHKVVMDRDWLYTYNRYVNIIFKHPELDTKCEIHIDLYWIEEQGEKLDLRCYIQGADVFEERDQSSYLHELDEITPGLVTEMVDEHLPEIFKIMREEIFFDLSHSFDYKDFRDSRAKLKKAKAQATRIYDDTPIAKRIIRSNRRKWFGSDSDDL